MSTTIATLRTRFPDPAGWSMGAADTIALTTFSGRAGRNLQLTIPRDGYIPLTPDDARHMATILALFAEGVDPDDLARAFGGDGDARDAKPGASE